MHPLNNISSTTGAKVTANGKTYHIGRTSISCWLTEIFLFTKALITLTTKYIIYTIPILGKTNEIYSLYDFLKTLKSLFKLSQNSITIINKIE